MDDMNPFLAEDTESSVGRISPSVPSGAVETARMLLSASPSKAHEFALAMHERVAWGFDTELIEHWARVVTELGKIPRIELLAG
jgi:hypothetical protein